MKTALICILCFLSLGLSAQKYTYFGAGLGLATTRFQVFNYPGHANSGPILTGGCYDVFLRQNILKILSVELGINVGGSTSYIELQSGEIISLWTGVGLHNVPLNIEIESDVYKDCISLYGSIGSILTYKQTTNGSWSVNSPDGQIIYVDWDRVEKGKFCLLYSLGFGSRYRLIDKLYFDLELKYVFGFNVLRAYHFTYDNDSGTTITEDIDAMGSHWQFKFGFSYPIQRVADGIKKAATSVKESDIFY